MKFKILQINIQKNEILVDLNHIDKPEIPVIIESNIQSAIKELNCKKFELVIINSEYFTEECIGIIEKIKSIGRLQHLPVLVYTTNISNADKIKILEKGAHDCMSGVVNLNELKLKIHNLIDLSKHTIFQETQFDEKSIANNPNTKFIEKLITCIEENISNEKLDLPLLSNSLNLSTSAIQKKIKKYCGKSVSVFVREYRLNRAQALIEKSEYPISKIVEMVGFGGASYFSKCYKEYFGFTPCKRNSE